MLGPSPDQGQADPLKNLLSHQLNPQHPLYLGAQEISWTKLEKACAPLYGRVGLPSHSMRKMTALLMRKHLYHLSDERVGAHWATNLSSPERPLSSGANPVLLAIEYTLDTAWERHA
jgi:hypothetical protein